MVMAWLAVVPRWAWAAAGGALAAFALIWAAWAWHSGEVDAARLAGAAAQKEIDTAAFEQAAADAARLQAADVARVRAADAAVAKRTENDLRVEIDELRRTAGDLRMRWQAARADSRGTSGGGVPGIASTAAIAADRACAASGGLSFDTAIAALEDAESDAALVRGWQAWWAGLETVERE